MKTSNKMALIFLGSSKCSICGRVLESEENIIGWQAFLNKEHKFWPFSDSGMHLECFNKWEHKEEFEHLYNYKPLVDFNSPELTKHIEVNGIPDWLKKIIDYRKNKSL